MNPAGRLFPKQSADCLGTPSYFIDLPGMNPCKSSRATGRAPQKRRRAGGSGDASHGGTMFPRDPPPASRRGLAPREPAAAFSLIVASGGWAPIFLSAVPPGFPNTAVGPPRPSGNLEAIFLPLSFPSPPVLAVGPADPPAGFWLPSKPTAAFSLIVAPSN